MDRKFPLTHLSGKPTNVSFSSDFSPPPIPVYFWNTEHNCTGCDHGSKGGAPQFNPHCWYKTSCQCLLGTSLISVQFRMKKSRSTFPAPKAHQSWFWKDCCFKHHFQRAILSMPLSTLVFHCYVIKLRFRPTALWKCFWFFFFRWQEVSCWSFPLSESDPPKTASDLFSFWGLQHSQNV